MNNDEHNPLFADSKDLKLASRVAAIGPGTSMCKHDPESEQADDTLTGSNL